MRDADHRVKQIAVRRASRVLEIEWGDGRRSDLAFALLRARCRCASCRSAALRAGRDPAPGIHGAVAIADVRPVGSYALQLVFSDGHDRGIFPFRYLRELGMDDGVEPRAHDGAERPS